MTDIAPLDVRKKNKRVIRSVLHLASIPFFFLDSNYFPCRTEGLPPPPPILRPGRALHNTSTSFMKGASQARFLIPLYNQSYGACTHITHRDNGRYAEPMFSPTEGMNVSYGNLCACQANFCCCYKMICSQGGNQSLLNSSRQTEEPSTYHEELTELQRRHCMEQISMQCHFPPPTEGLSPHHNNTMFKQGQSRSTELIQLNPGVFPLATTQVNGDIGDDAFGTHSHGQSKLQALKDDHENAKDKTKPKKRRKKSLRKRITLSETINPETNKRLKRMFLQSQKVRTVWINAQTSLLQGFLSQQQHDQAEPSSGSGSKNMRANKFKDDGSIDSDVQFICSTSKSEETCSDNTPPTTNFNPDSENFLPQLPPDMDGIYEEQATPMFDSAFPDIITQEPRDVELNDSATFPHSTSLSHETCSNNTPVTTSFSQDGESFLAGALPLERNVSNKTIYEEDITFNDCGGYTFDYGDLPKIVAVHTIEDIGRQSWWKELDQAEKLSSTENIQLNEMLGGTSSNDGGSNEECFNNSGLRQNAPGNYQVESSEQTAIHSSTVQPRQSLHISKPEELVNRDSRELNNHVGSNVLVQREYADQNEDLARQRLAVGEFLPSSVCHENKSTSLSNVDDPNEIRRRIEIIAERIMREITPYKKDILCNVKRLLIKRLSKLEKTSRRDEYY